MMVTFVFAALFVVLAVTFLMGKGDKLIAGYNTASEEERKKFDIHRLRLLMVSLSVITAVFCASIPFIGNNRRDVLSATFFFIVVSIFIIIIANTWAKKKKQ